MRRHRLLAIILCLVLLSALWSASAASPEIRTPLDGREPSVSPGPAEVPLEARRKIAPDLLKQLLEARQRAPGQGGSFSPHTTYLVHLREEASLEDLVTSADRLERRERLVERLQSTARRSQAGLVSYLEQQLQKGSISRHQSYWIFNGLAVDGDLETAIQLALRPEVESIRPNRIHHLPAPEIKVAESAMEPEWGVTRIKADRVWSELGITGLGVVVANIDSGVDWTHPALQSKYRGYNAANPSASTHDYNWIDLTDTYPNAPGPNRGHVSNISDHGTHTMGTMVGSDPAGGKAIGVAPGAKWIAVKAFNDQGDATDENIHAGFQWCLAPTNLRGANPDPSKAPDIVNNSWGDDNGTDETFRQDVAVMRAAGILCTFSAGNAGPGSGTVGSPASFPEAFSVGAIDSADGIASFSARGPSPWGGIKPEVVAPGVSINSAIAGGTYESWNGTSMAAPHVAGLAALVLQAARMARSTASALQRDEGIGLTITATERIITSTARNLGVPGADNVYGFGCVDAYQAVGAVVESGTFAGRVTDEATGAPLAGAWIIMRNLATGGQASTQTQADGSYSFAVAQGSYDVTASKFGYQDALVQNVQVLANTTTQLDFPLMALPSGIVRGRVTRTTDQQPVPAVVRLAGTTGEAVVDSQGYYSFSVPAGTYAVRAVATVPGYRGSERQNVTLAVGDVLTLDFILTPGPRILLVDADAWASSYAIGYYRSALENLLYSYDTWAIPDFPAGNPSADKLAQYELVIWAQPKTSPGYITAWSELAAYLGQGGRLLISGEDIGYWDYQSGAATSYRDYLHANYLEDDGGLIPISGLPREILDGIRLEFNTADSARNQTAPDAVACADALAHAVIASHPETVFGLRADGCTHRVVYLSFGLEGVGPQTSREQVLTRAIAWLAADRPANGVGLSFSVSSRVGAPGSTVTYDLVLVNEGKRKERFLLSVESPMFPARLINPATGQAITTVPEITPCAILPLRLLVTIPEDAVLGKTESTTVTVVSSSPGFPDFVATQSAQTIAFRPWTQVSSLPTPRYRLGSAAHDCTIYTFSGLLDDDEGTIANVVELFDLRSGTWTTGTPKPNPAANYATAQLGGRVYLIGGWNSDAPGQFLNTVEAYDLGTDTWSVCAPLPRPLAGMAAAAVGGKVYAFGGRNGEGSSRGTFIYDPQTRTWSQGAALPVDVVYGSAVSLDGFVYVAGGWPASKALLRYDPASDSWAVLASMHVGRQSCGIVTVGGFIYVAGGGDEWAGLASVERYDPAADLWMDLPSLHMGERAGATGVSVDGRFYLFGGTGSGAGAVERLEVRPPLGGSSFSASAQQAKVGDALRYTLTLRNADSESRAASWLHVLPELLDLVQGSPTGGATYDPARRELRWQGALAASSTASFEFSATVSPRAADGTVITSTLTVDDGECVFTQLSTTAQVSMPSLARSILTVDKANAAPGEELHYTICVMNGSPYTVSGASLVNAIPKHTTLVAGSLTGATYDAAQGRIEWTGTLPPADTAAPVFRWIAVTGQPPLSLRDDSCVESLDLGFEFEFYGRRYSTISVNSNGQVLFGSCSQAYRNGAIPSPEEPNGFVAPFWDDLIPGSGGVYMATLGTAPNRYAVVEWRDVSFYGQSESQTFEVILYEGSNRVICQYLDVNGERGKGSSATVGIENQDGTEGVQYLLNGSPAEHALHDELAIEMVHSSTSRATTHIVSYAVRIAERVPPHTIISNTALISDPYAIHERTVTTTLYAPSFAGSSKTVEPARALPGDTVTYTLRLVNSGAYEAVDTLLTDVLPVEVAYVPGSLVGDGATYNATQRRIEWRGNVAVGAEPTMITYRATLNQGLAVNQRITNTAGISVQGVTMGTWQATLVASEINLGTSSKTASASEVVAGAPITYTITLRNTGLATAENVTMRDQLPSMTSLVPGSLVGGTYDGERRAIVWTGALVPSAEHVVSYRVDTDANLRNGTLIMNGVSLSDGHGPPIAFTAVTRVLRGDLSSSDMSVSPSWLAPGGAVMVTMRLRNTGAVAIGGRLRYVPPTPLSIVAGSAYASSGAVSQPGQELEWNGSILPQAMVIVRFQVTAPPGTPVQATNNEATLRDAGGLEQVLGATIIVNPRLMFFAEVHR